MASRSHPWLNRKLAVGPSAIAGDGLIALADIEAGEMCCRLSGTAMNDDEFARFVASRESYSAFAVDEDQNLVQDDDDPTTRGNGACDPNMWMLDATTIVARRSILRGEEATIDYALVTVDPAWTLPCNCQTAVCRGVIRGTDWRRPNLQQRYRGHWSPFIERRIGNWA